MAEPNAWQPPRPKRTAPPLSVAVRVSDDELERLHRATQKMGIGFPDALRTLLISALEDVETGVLTFEASE